MTPIELFALSLALSIAVAAIAGLTAAGLERATTDPALRDRAWAWALYLPVLPPLAVAATLLTPAPVRPLPILPTPTLTTEVIEALPVAIAPATPTLTLDLGQLALAALILAALLVVFRLASLALRGWRLNRLIAHTQPASPDTRSIVAECAARLGVASPTVRAGPAVGDALLTGLTRPVLVLPQAVADTPDTLAAHAVITHELAHMKRGDHRAVWIEEAVVALLAANPILPLIRARGAAAREEACDALALAGADPVARRAYATSLIEALRARTDPTTLPALTFNGTPRSQAMRRLKSILTPPATAGHRTRAFSIAAGLGLLTTTGLVTAAVASQREAVLAPTRQTEPASSQQVVAVSASEEAQSAARQAAAAARSTLTSEQRERFRDPSVADYRRICASRNPADDGFCSGVIFSQLGKPDLCTPEAIDNRDQKISGPALGALVERAKAQFDAIPMSEAGSPPQLAHAALRRAYPCGEDGVYMEAQGMALLDPATQAALHSAAPGWTRLWLTLDAGAVTATPGDALVVSLRGEVGEGYLVKTSSHDITMAGVPDVIVLDLEPDYLPAVGTANRTYALEARVEREGQTIYLAEPATIRVAAGSQAALSRMRPELRLAPVGR